MTERSLYPAIFVPILAVLLLGTIGFFGVLTTTLLNSSHTPPSKVAAWSFDGVTGQYTQGAPLAASEEARKLPQGQPDNQPAGSPQAAPQRYPDHGAQ